ncbi:MAG: prepilin peptidase, partial [Planctomycetota bacterium]
GGVLICGMITMPLVTVVPWQLTLPLRWPPGLWWDADTLGWSDQAVQAAVRLITALAAAGFWGRVLSRTLCPKADLKLSPLGSPTRRLIDLIATIAVIAIVVGWQATALVLTLASLLATRCVLQRFSITVRGQRQSLDRDDPLARLAIACPIALVIALVTWRFWWHAFLWPEETASRTALLVTFLAVFCIPLWLQQTNPDHRDVPRSMDGS